MDGHNRVLLALRHRPDGVAHPLLHLRVRALHRVQLDGTRVHPGVHRRHGSAAHPDAVIVPAQQHHLLARFHLSLHRLRPVAETDASRLHDDLVIPVGLPVLLMLERQHRTANQRLPELVPEIRRPVRRLDENILRRLIQPTARVRLLLPQPSRLQARVRGHIHRRPCQRQRRLPSRDAVAYLPAATRRRPVERLHRRREIMRLRLQRNHRVDVPRLEEIRLVVRPRRELLHPRSLDERAVILVRRHDPVRMLRRRPFNQFEQRGLLLLPVDDESPVENLMPAMLRIDLREPEHLRIRQLPPQLLLQPLQVSHLLRIQRQPLLLVVAPDILDVHHRLRLLVDGEYTLVQPLVQRLQHRVVRRPLILHLRELLHTHHALDAHILRNLHRIRAPRRNHLPPRSHKTTCHPSSFHPLRPAEQPFQLARIQRTLGLAILHGIHRLTFLIENYCHIFHKITFTESFPQRYTNPPKNKHTSPN